MRADEAVPPDVDGADDQHAVFHGVAEQVRVQVTEERRTYLRADAVEILRAAPSRVTPT